jgi:colicin import membrane protein
MVEFVRQHWTYLIGALLLHVLFAGVFGLTLISIARNPPPAQLAIQAVVVDASKVPASRRQQRERAAAEQRRQEQEAQARREAEQRAEQERQVELQQRAEEENRKQAEEQQARERLEAERKQAEEKQRQVDAERKRVADIERKQKEEAQKRKAAEESKAQSVREEELRSQLEEEEGRMQAEKSGALNEYIALIEQRIVRNWNRPPSARAGLECEVRVAQAPGGTVLSVQIGQCNGDAAVKQSIEAAVMRSSPLPPPPDARLFERNLVLIFKPLD